MPDAPRVLRSFAKDLTRMADAEAAEMAAEVAADLIELWPGQYVRVQPRMPRATMYQIITRDEPATLAWAIDRIEEMIVPEDREAFRATLFSDERPFPPEAVYPIYIGLVEDYNARPTTPSSPSGDGRQSTGRRSGRGAGSTASTRKRATARPSPTSRTGA